MLKNWLECFLRIEAEFDALNKLLGVSAESPLIRAMYEGHDLATKYLSELLGDENNMLDWFLWDNQCGERQLKAKAPSWKKARKINSLKSLAAFIEGS